MTPNYTNVFDLVDRVVDNDPHGAIASFVREYCRIKLGHRFSRSDFQEIFNGLKNGAPGLGLEYGGTLMGYYEGEFMDDYGIDPFPDGEAFLAIFENMIYFDEVLYSRAKTCGWLCLGIMQFARDCPDEQSRLLSALSFACSPTVVVKDLVDKIEGKYSWKYGPVGSRQNEADTRAWHSAQGPDAKRRYIAGAGMYLLPHASS